MRGKGGCGIASRYLDSMVISPLLLAWTASETCTILRFNRGRGRLSNRKQRNQMWKFIQSIQIHVKSCHRGSSRAS